jgi:REP element-mobilizing transposase RayT
MPNVPSPQPHRGWHSRGYLPHWDHPGIIQSLNFRLGDAMPNTVLHKWRMELSLKREDEKSVELRRRVEKYLDAGHGTCWLRRSSIAQLVENSLLHFDGERYVLLAWCIMPNHVHVLVETKVGLPLASILQTWKSFIAHKANTLLSRTGEFWQREYLDRYVRNAEHYERVVAYIEENPVKARLAKLRTEWPWSSAKFRCPGSAGVSPASS